mgnify:CR=1 FL=1|jgi:hypothetical protein
MQLPKIRPQIFTALVALSIICIYGMNLGNLEISSAATGGIIALSMRLLERDA